MWQRTGSLVGSLVGWLGLAVACGDDATAGDDTTGGGSDTSSGAATSSGPPTTADGTSTDTGPGDGETEASSSDSGEPVVVACQAQTTGHPSQPMVVDVQLQCSDPAFVTLTHDTDPGVVVANEPAGGDPLVHDFRVRGLAPDTRHALTWTARPRAGGDAASGEVGLLTGPPQPGFIPSFSVEGGDSFGGYVLFDMLPFPGPGPASLFVVDGDGVTRWYYGVDDGVTGPVAVYAAANLRPDGSVLFLRDNTITIVDELGVELLSIPSGDLGLPGLHHDVTELPDGNFLALSNSFHDVVYPDIGLTHIAGDLVVEVSPLGELVWQWDTFDHLDPLRRRENFDSIVIDRDGLQLAFDWTHGNAVVYDAASDTFLLSTRHQDWISLVDHATGDLLWNLGDEGDFTLTAGTWFFHQHSPQWQADGTLLLYDNGVGNPALPPGEEFSRAARYALDFGTMEATLVWEDDAEDFTSTFAGDADRLPNGRVLVTDSSIGFDDGMLHARLREVDEASSAVPTWAITTMLDHFIYRATAWDRLPGQTAP